MIFLAGDLKVDNEATFMKFRMMKLFVRLGSSRTVHYKTAANHAQIKVVWARKTYPFVKSAVSQIEKRAQAWLAILM